ncbi:recombinase family protein [Chloroflexota bacterium]
MKVAIYLKDADKEQITDLRKWVEGEGFTDISEYIDVTGLRGHPKNNELLRLIGDAREHKINSVFVSSVDQLYPDRSNVFLLALFLSEHGVRLFSRGGKWTNFPPGDIMLYIQQHIELEAEVQKKVGILMDILGGKNKTSNL